MSEEMVHLVYMLSISLHLVLLQMAAWQALLSSCRRPTACASPSSDKAVSLRVDSISRNSTRTYVSTLNCSCCRHNRNVVRRKAGALVVIWILQLNGEANKNHYVVLVQ